MTPAPAATASANTNIALIKYWGKADESLTIPTASSLSLTLGATRTTTTGPFTVQQGYATDAQGGGVWLTRQDQIMLAPWRLGLVCAPLVSERAP